MSVPRIPTERLAQLRSIALVEIAKDGTVQWANAGFQRLLPTWAHDAASVQAQRFFLSPSVAELQRLAQGQTSPCYEGLLTLGDPDARPQSLRGRVFAHGDGLLVIAEHDLDEMMHVSDAAMRLSADLTRSQRELIAINRRLAEREAEIHSLSVTDQLTGLGNRRRLDESLATALSAARQRTVPFCVVMVDLDHFKAVNDAFGHGIGDRLLQVLGQTLEAGVRNTDTVCRFGGEEFAIVMPDIDMHGACACSERIRLSVEKLPQADGMPPVTATFGVAQWQAGDTADSLLQRADQSLYQGKAAGRNCVICAEAANATPSSLSAAERARQSWASASQPLVQQTEHVPGSRSPARKDGGA